jgi:transcription factor E
LLYGKKNINEFVIAKKLKLTINQTRNILYKLADEGVVSFLRKKDRKKGGWYTYFWTLNIGKGLLRMKEGLSKKIENLQNQLNVKKHEKFFYCPNCDSEAGEESALLHGYVCPECGEVLQVKEKTKDIESLEREIKKLEGVLGAVNAELEIVGKKEDVVRARKARAETKKKAKERAIKKRKKELELRKLKGKGAEKKKKKSKGAKAKRSARKAKGGKARKKKVNRTKKRKFGKKRR